MARLAERKAAAETDTRPDRGKAVDERSSQSVRPSSCAEFDSLTALRAQVADLRGKIRALAA